MKIQQCVFIVYVVDSWKYKLVNVTLLIKCLQHLILWFMKFLITVSQNIILHVLELSSLVFIICNSNYNFKCDDR